MKLRHKLILLAVLPLLLALAAIAATLLYQAQQMALQQRAAVQQVFLQNKQAELRHYLKLGLAAIDELYQQTHNQAAAQAQAKRVLSQLDFGSDGYFFIYDLNGTNIMHPRQPELPGKNLWDQRDPQGRYTIRELINTAQEGGGTLLYTWRKPSSGQLATKLGYVLKLERWGWVVGTGLYMDEIDQTLQKLDQQVSENRRRTLIWIAMIALISTISIAACGLLLNMSESRLAEQKLKMLAQNVVHSQEEERARLSRDLHDGLSQLLVSTKLLLESAIDRFTPGASSPPNMLTNSLALAPMQKALAQLNQALAEVRQISHDLRPALLDDLGLEAACQQLADEFEQASGMAVSFEVDGETPHLSGAANTMLYRILQEALTNIHKHAKHANQVRICLHGDAQHFLFSIHDNGAGFVWADVANNPGRGIGISNMRERLAAIGGQLKIHSGAQGTSVIAQVPNHYET